MHYSAYFLAALPVVAALPFETTVTHVVYETKTVDYTLGGEHVPAPTPHVATPFVIAHESQEVANAPIDESPAAPAAYVPITEPEPEPPIENHPPAEYIPSTEPVHEIPTSENPPAAYMPITEPVHEVPTAEDTSINTPPATYGSSGACPADPSTQYLSKGVDGNPDKSMLDSVNYIRRLYNPAAKCLSWSPTLHEASQNCADGATESLLRSNSAVVSDDGGFAKSPAYFTGSLATTEFERSAFVLLCQSPDDPELLGQCPGKVGEKNCGAGCSGTGHHDVMVDAKGEYNFVGAGINPSTGWMSSSFSKTCDVFGDCTQTPTYLPLGNGM